MKYDRKAHPLIYKGRLYRSTLEVKWAVFFDYLGWKFEYEPMSFNNWIPDFALYGHNQIILIEVKPICEFDKEVAAKILTASGGKYEILLLGLKPDWETNRLGWLYEKDWGMGWDEGWINANKKYGFYHCSGSYRDRITGEYDGDNHLRTPMPNEIELLWNETCNKL